VPPPPPPPGGGRAGRRRGRGEPRAAAADRGGGGSGGGDGDGDSVGNGVGSAAPLSLSSTVRRSGGSPPHFTTLDASRPPRYGPGYEGADRERERDRVDGGRERDDAPGTLWRENNAKLVAAAQRGGGRAAAAALDEMVAAGTAFQQNYNQAVSLLAADGDIEGGLALAATVADVGLANVITYRPLMKYCGSKGDAPHAMQTMAAMRGAGVVPDMFVYAELMSSLVRAGQVADAEGVLREIVADGRRPHVVLFNTLLSGYSREANVPRAMALISQLREAGLEPDETTFNIALDCCALGGGGGRQRRPVGVVAGVCVCEEGSVRRWVVEERRFDGRCMLCGRVPLRLFYRRASAIAARCHCGDGGSS